MIGQMVSFIYEDKKTLQQPQNNTVKYQTIL